MKNPLGMIGMEAAIYNRSTEKVILFKSTEALVKALKRYGQRGYTAKFNGIIWDVHPEGFISVSVFKRSEDYMAPRVADTPGWQGIHHYTKLVWYNNEIVQELTE